VEIHHFDLAHELRFLAGKIESKHGPQNDQDIVGISSPLSASAPGGLRFVALDQMTVLLFAQLS
jgi:hypothetical protein